MCQCPFGGMQYLGVACRVSCASPVLGPSIGVIGVGIASAMAGQAAVHCQHHFKTGRHPLSIGPRTAFQRKDLVLDACMGILLYKASQAIVKSVALCCGVRLRPGDLADDGGKVLQCHAKRPVQAGSIGSGFLASSWPAVRISKLQRRAADTDAQVHQQLCALCFL